MKRARHPVYAHTITKPSLTGKARQTEGMALYCANPAKRSNGLQAGDLPCRGRRGVFGHRQLQKFFRKPFLKESRLSLD